jgi:hypothetical protein
MKKYLLIAMAICAFTSAQARADPKLQLYVEGSTYDTGTSTWTISSTVGGGIRLWVIGQGDLTGVNIYIASPTTDALTYTVTRDRIGGTGTYPTPGGSTAFTDSGLAPTSPSANGSGTGTTPAGQSPHGIYGSGVSWTSWGLGTFDANNTAIADFSGTSPINPETGNHATMGTIYAYDIKFTGAAVSTTIPINIDAGFSPYGNDDKAPYSHTARGGFGGPGGIQGPNPIPEPSTMLIAAVGAMGFVGYGMRRRKMS